MKPRDIARAARIIASQEARRTRATWRGNVDSVNEDGSAQITLPNGGEITVTSSNLFKFSVGESVTLLRNSSNLFEALGPSGYQGGLGAPFAPP